MRSRQGMGGSALSSQATFLGKNRLYDHPRVAMAMIPNATAMTPAAAHDLYDREQDDLVAGGVPGPAAALSEAGHADDEQCEGGDDDVGPPRIWPGPLSKPAVA